ncbi:hypothetical protein SAMN05421812_12848 [Asanoa hainanensis]|uniref:Uncharacterized protein n=1 Tax=Asanoa hainanensis TaxID=560556 RepID=A0A239PFV5_9ACTN|nr:hypothetical protein [Asanoa hainanensis]SNT65902.1 hypothetical protein SAMN05421812_12848 [Asanoa hainanensis]
MRRHSDPGKLATLYAEVDPSAKEFFSKIAVALNCSLAEAVERVVQRLEPPGTDPEALPEWVQQEVARTQLPSGEGSAGGRLAAA